MKEPVIAFGQQPCGIFPKRFLFAKIVTARRLQRKAGGRIVFFYHDADHDPRETVTGLYHRQSGEARSLNFQFRNKIQKKYSPLYCKDVVPEWKENTARQLPALVEDGLVELFSSIESENVADFCLEMYRGMGLLEGIEVVRSSDPEVRARAIAIEDYFMDVSWEGEIVRARKSENGCRLHCGGTTYIDLEGPEEYDPKIVSPTRDERLRWMQSVIHCTHYVAGAGEMGYLDTRQTPEIEFVKRDEIERASDAYTSLNSSLPECGTEAES